MKKNFKVKSKNRKVLESFINYCIKHPELRFWQALTNWSGYYFIYASNALYDETPLLKDVYYLDNQND